MWLLYTERAIFDRCISRKRHIHTKRCEHIHWKSHTRQIYLSKKACASEKIYTCILKEAYSIDISVERGIYIWRGVHIYIQRTTFDRYIYQTRHINMQRDISVKRGTSEVYIERVTFDRYICRKRHIHLKRDIYMSREAFTYEEVYTYILQEAHSTDTYLSKETYEHKKRYICQERHLHMERCTHVY